MITLFLVSIRALGSPVGHELLQLVAARASKVSKVASRDVSIFEGSALLAGLKGGRRVTIFSHVVLMSYVCLQLHQIYLSDQVTVSEHCRSLVRHCCVCSPV